METRKPLPTDELRDGIVGVFSNSDDKAETMNLTDPDVSVAAFRATFYDVPEIQSMPLSFK